MAVNMAVKASLELSKSLSSIIPHDLQRLVLKDCEVLLNSIMFCWLDVWHGL